MATESKPVRKCRYCTKEFRVNRKWMVFCSDRCRIQHNRHNYELCFYCGDAAKHRDHVTPCYFLGYRTFRNIELVLSCQECNCLLGGVVDIDIEARMERLIKAIHKRHKLHRRAMRWDEDEVEDLGRNLKAKIRKLLRVRAKAEERYVYAQAVLHSLQADRV